MAAALCVPLVVALATSPSSAVEGVAGCYSGTPTETVPIAPAEVSCPAGSAPAADGPGLCSSDGVFDLLLSERLAVFERTEAIPPSVMASFFEALRNPVRGGSRIPASDSR